MNKKLDQKGAVSIISVVIFATIITVLITAYLRSAVSQQAEATNYDFSTRAFYTAESGIQDTLRIMKSDQSRQATKDTCSPFTENSSGMIGPAEFNLNYTCQLVSFNPTEISGSVVPNKESAVIELQPSSLVVSPNIEIRWSQQYNPDATVPGDILYPQSYDVPIFRPINKWYRGGDDQRPVHALLRVAVIRHPRNTTYTRDQISQQVVFFNPTDAAKKQSPADLTINGATVGRQQEQLFNNAECYPSNSTPADKNMKSYSCRQTINISDYDFSSQRIYLKISSLYRPTSFSAELISGGSTVSLLNTQAEIDITARAGGDVYRRVKQKVPLGGYQISRGVDAALVAGEGICKQLTLGAVTDVYRSECNPLVD